MGYGFLANSNEDLLPRAKLGRRVKFVFAGIGALALAATVLYLINAYVLPPQQVNMEGHNGYDSIIAKERAASPAAR